jgi:nitrate reductase gamma subunit
MDTVLFAVIPYLALALAIGGGLYRYFTRRSSFTSRSSQLLEHRTLFWGSIPWHFGILVILLAHLFAGLLPGLWARVLGGPTRLAVLELCGLALALYTVVGIVLLVVRRLRRGSAAQAVTSRMDWVLLVILATQVVLGFLIALTSRWGARWYLDTAAPWFRSIWRLSPDGASMVPLPALVKVHAALGLTLIALFPFTRLVHLVSVPLSYLWRPYQLVVWGSSHGGGTAMPFPGPGAHDGRSTEGSAAGPASTPPAREAAEAPLRGPAAEPGRRGFLSALGIGLSSLVAAVVAVPSIGFLLGLRRTPTVWQGVGRADSFAVNRTVEVAFSDPSPLPWAGVTARTAAWLRRTGAETFVAFSVNCTHLGCPVRWLPDAELFMCPCHGGVYYHDGRVAAGPPPRPLVRYPVRVRDGQVEIQTGPLPIAT